MRLLYLYPEEWTGTRDREVYALSTCVALAESGVEVTLVTAGGEMEMHDHLLELADATEVPGLNLVVLSRTLGPVQSTAIFSRNFTHWMRNRRPFDLGFTLHLKAGPILNQVGVRYAYEAHGIFAQMTQTPTRQRAMHKLEGDVLATASLIIATSMPLAVALSNWFALTTDIAIIPNAGQPPLGHGVSEPDGPFVYCGHIDDKNELAGLIQAANELKAPLKIVGGLEEEWRTLSEQLNTSGIEWQRRVPLGDLPGVLVGARAGLIPTNPDTATGEFSCPLKLFDYARCGLPVVTTALPALKSLDVGPWCTQVASPTRISWVEALREFRHEHDHAEAARAWSGAHTWAFRAEAVKQAIATRT